MIKSESSWHICVDMGDLIYSLLFAKLTDAKNIYIDGGCGTVKFNWNSANFLLPLIKSQPYLFGKVELYNNQPYDHDYGHHPQNIPVVVGTNLTAYHASKFDLPNTKQVHDPWLYADTIEDSMIRNKKVLINRTQRYHGNNSFYYDFLKYFHLSELLFLGLESEYSDFLQDFNIPSIDYIKTPSSLDLINIINSIPTFIGNQSLICAIATGLGKNMFIEYCPNAANYIFQRQNIKYF